MQSYDNDKDGSDTELAGCEVMISINLALAVTEDVIYRLILE